VKRDDEAGQFSKWVSQRALASAERAKENEFVGSTRQALQPRQRRAASQEPAMNPHQTAQQLPGQEKRANQTIQLAENK
jgi:hypothetical protein